MLIWPVRPDLPMIFGLSEKHVTIQVKYTNPGGRKATKTYVTT